MYIPKKWLIKENNIDLVAEISNRLNISMAVSAVLVSRGLKSVRDADVFLNPNFFDLENPFILSGMEQAIKRLRDAIDSNQKILIYGDRDVDGVTAVCVIYFALKSAGVTPLWYIPSEEGYGLHKSVIDKYADEGVKLIITVDCGICNSEEISYAKSKGIDVIVTDHHEPPDVLPQNAVALIDPKIKDNRNNSCELAGCVVALKLAHALMMSYEGYYDKDMVVVDIETTGLHPVFDEIVEIAAIKIRNFVVKDTFHSLIKPDKNIPEDVIEIHGITNEMCENAPSAGEVLRKFVEFVGNSPVIAHNAQFDISFIRNYVKKLLNLEFDNPVIDTLSLSREFFPFRSHALGSLVRDLGFEFTHLHRAMDDAIATLSVYYRLEQIKNTRLRFFLQDNLDLVTIGTIGDMMPLSGENRILVKHGIDALKKSKRIGIRVLVEKFFDGEKIKAKNISFTIVPFLNSCGRMGRAELAVKLLTSENRAETEKILQEIVKINDERRELQFTNIEKFLELLRLQCDTEKDKLFFVVGSDIEHGVTGIVASQIVKQYYRPVILVIIEGDTAIGTGRSIDGVNLYSIIEKCGDIFVKFGGHPQAIGFTIRAEKIEELRNRLKEISEKEIPPESLEPIIEVDTELKLSEANEDLVSEIEELEPFGMGNPYPVFLIDKLRVEDYSRIGSIGEHLRMRLSQNNFYANAIGWGLGEFADSVLRISKYISVVAQIVLNKWQNGNSVELLVLDIKPVL